LPFALRRDELLAFPFSDRHKIAVLPCMLKPVRLMFLAVVWGCWLLMHNAAGVATALEKPEPVTKFGGIYHRMLPNNPPLLDPAYLTDIYARTVATQIFDGLVQFDALLNPIPAIAEFWEASRDGRTWTFSLRRGVRFHHGREVTAYDFVYSFTRLLDAKKPGPLTVFLRRIQGANDFMKGTSQSVHGLKAVDRYTLRITLDEPFAPLLAVLGLANAAVVPREKVEGQEQRFSHFPVGTGPFKFVRWEPDKEIVLEANDRYHEGRPFLDTVMFKIGGTFEEMFAEFLNGKLEDTLIPSAKTDEVRIDPRYRQYLLFTEILREQTFQALDDSIYLHDLLSGTGAREVEQFPNDASDTSDLLFDLPEVPFDGVIRLALVPDDPDGGFNDRQGVIDFVRNPGGQLTQSGQPLALNELLLRLSQAAIGFLQKPFLVLQAGSMELQRGAQLCEGSREIPDLIRGVHPNWMIIRSFRKFVDACHQFTDRPDDSHRHIDRQQYAAEDRSQADDHEGTPSLMDLRVCVLQRKSKPDRSPFLRATGGIDGKGHIIASLPRLRDDDFLHQESRRLQGALTHRVIEVLPLEIAPPTVHGDSAIPPMGQGILDVFFVMDQFLDHLFQLDKVIAQHVTLAHGRQTSCRGDRSQAGLLDHRLALMPVHHKRHGSHQDNDQRGDGEDEFSAETSPRALEQSEEEIDQDRASCFPYTPDRTDREKRRAEFTGSAGHQVSLPSCPLRGFSEARSASWGWPSRPEN